MKKILIMEDEENIRSFVVINLKRAGYETIEAATGQEALDKIQDNPDIRVAILDIMLPDIDGFEVCRRIRATNKQMGIIMLTARTQEMDKITGLMNGADDYVTKPFSPMVLVKRVEALLRRAKPDITANEKNFSELIFNDDAHEVRLYGKEIDLTLKEYNILKKFLEAPGRVFSREQLLDSIWGYDYSGDIRTVDSHVARLRTKLGEWGNIHLKTVYGIGYKIEEQG
jgi:DNA-binding response OmpR family regulator